MQKFFLVLCPGPLLFNISINDVEKEREGMLVIFAPDAKLGGLPKLQKRTFRLEA